MIEIAQALDMFWYVTPRSKKARKFEEFRRIASFKSAMDLLYCHSTPRSPKAFG
jgi:hypothetical protein